MADGLLTEDGTKILFPNATHRTPSAVNDPVHFLVGGHFITYPGRKHSFSFRQLCNVENHDPIEIHPYDQNERLTKTGDDSYSKFKCVVKCDACTVRGAIMVANNLPTSIEGIQAMLRIVNAETT